VVVDGEMTTKGSLQAIFQAFYDLDRG